MYIEIFELDKNNLYNYTREDIKTIYKKIALECHPDKLCNISDENIKNSKIEKFKNASIAYKKALDDFDNYGYLTDFSYDDFNYTFDDFSNNYDMYKNMDIQYWKDIYNEFFSNKEEIERTFVNVAKMFIDKGISGRKYYNPSTSVINHSIVLPLSYYDLINTRKKKLQITLKGVEEPFNISVLCKNEYPFLKRQYIDDNGIEHEIDIKMILSNQKSKTGFKHEFNQDGTIDLITKINVNLRDYIMGSNKIIKYIDGNCIDIQIKPFDLNKIFINNKGLFGGDLIINLNYKNINIDEWNIINDEDKELMISIINKIYK